MGKITFPPSGDEGVRSKSFFGIEVLVLPVFCNKNSDDPLEFHVDEDGYLIRFGDGLFSPDIPDAFEAAGSDVEPCKPTGKNGTVIAGFLDFGRKILYLKPIEVKSSCP